jgi:PAS domain-containing protein
MTWEREIKYWAEHPDGTGVRHKTADGKWHRHGTVHWLENITYIVDDEWAELRKAQADGKDIYFKRDGKYIKQAEDWWKNEFYDAVHYTDLDEYEIDVEPEKKEWYECIPDEGIICWVWDNDENSKCLRLVVGFCQGAEYPFEAIINGFRNRATTNWKHAEPAKPEECWQGECK